MFPDTSWCALFMRGDTTGNSTSRKPPYMGDGALLHRFGAHDGERPSSTQITQNIHSGLLHVVVCMTPNAKIQLIASDIEDS